jgi:antitoxin HigA-1
MKMGHVVFLAPQAVDILREIQPLTGSGLNMAFKNGMRPVHSGEVLREDFMRSAGLSANALAKALHVPTPRINDIVRERRGVTAGTALRLARYFGGDVQSWLNLQSIYDLRVTQMATQKRIEREIQPPGE